MDIIKLIAGDNFIALNRDLLRHLGLNPALLLAELAGEQNYFTEKGMLTDDGFFFSTIENIEKNTSLSRKQQDAAIRELTQKGLIEYKVRGMPASRYFRVNQSNFLEILSKNDSLQFVQKGQTSLSERANKIVQKEQTSLSKKDNQVCPKGTGNNNNITIINNNNNKDLPNQSISHVMANCNLSNSLKEELKKWISYKSENGIELTERQVTDLISDLETTAEDFGEQMAVDAVDHAIRNKAVFVFSYKYGMAHKEAK